MQNEANIKIIQYSPYNGIFKTIDGAPSLPIYCCSDDHALFTPYVFYGS